MRLPDPNEGDELILERTRSDMWRFCSNKFSKMVSCLERELELERGISNNLRELLAIREQELRQARKRLADCSAKSDSQRRDN